MMHSTGNDRGSAGRGPRFASGPQPGWVTLDDARRLGFTGEVVFEDDPAVAVYFDSGIAYYAERASDAPVGQRLVETGVIDPIELARGTVSVGAVEHLGRLFDRNPSVDRDVVLVAVSIMTSDLIVDIANRSIPSVSVTAYRHHRSGMHGWFVGSFDPSQLMRSIGQLGSAVVGSLPVSSDLAPVSALMAVPAPPVEPVPPAFTRLADLPVADFDADELTIDWNEPFDDPPPSAVFGGVPFTNGADPGRLGSRG